MHKFFRGGPDAGQGRDWGRGRDGVIHHLLETIDQLRHDTDPAKGAASEAGKDAKAHYALALAGKLTHELVGWAIAHKIGMAAESVPPVPELPLSPAGLEQRARAQNEANRHENEIRGGQDGGLPAQALRRILGDLLAANSLGLPLDVVAPLREAVQALDFGETRPVFQASKRGAKTSFRQRRLQIRAFEHVAYHKELRSEKSGALKADFVEAFGLSGGEKTFNQWRSQMRDRGDDRLAVDRAETRGKLAAAHVQKVRRAVRLDEFVSSFDEDLAAAYQDSYSDSALLRLGREYRAASDSEEA